MTLVIKVHGIPEALEAFRDLPRTVQNKHMRIAMNAGGGVIRDAMASRTPTDTGLLKRSFRVKVSVPNASYNVAHHGRPAYAVIGPSRNVAGIQTFRKSGRAGMVKQVRIKRKGGVDTFTRSGLGVATTLHRPSRYWHLVERGVKAHAVSVKAARVLSNGDATFGRKAQHPGVSAKQIAAGAVSSSGAAAQAKVISKLHSGISEWAAKRAAKVNTPAMALA